MVRVVYWCYMKVVTENIKLRKVRKVGYMTTFILPTKAYTNMSQL